MAPTHHLHVVTGGPGSGRSTLIDALVGTGIATRVAFVRAHLEDA